MARLHGKQVANLITVGGNHQVQLSVRFAEVSRSGLKQIGVNLFGGRRTARRSAAWSGRRTSSARSSTQQDFHVPGTGLPGQPPVFPTAPFGQSFQLFFGSATPFPFNVTLSLLEENGLAKVLAEPTLATLSGQEAKFLAGGEIPIPLATSLGALNVQWKKFGIQLGFTPTVLDQGTINLKVAAEVSDIDPANGVQANGIFIPGITSRQAETTVRLGDGQSFAIAGLMSEKVRSTIDKVPGLGSIPILGALFRSSQYQSQETELLVVITVRLVKPVAPARGAAASQRLRGAEPRRPGLLPHGVGQGGAPKRSPQSAPRGPSGPGGFAP